MANTDLGTATIEVAQRARRLPAKLRPGMILGVSVVGLVGLVGVVQWDQRLILTGLIAGMAIIFLNGIVVALRHWHLRNTSPGATYVDAEDLVRLRQPKTR